MIYNLDFGSVQILTEMSFQKPRSRVSQEQLKWIDKWQLQLLRSELEG